MEAIVWHGRRDVRWEELPNPADPAVGQVRVRVAFAGICGTDLEEYLAGPIYIPVGAPHPLTGRRAPLTLGHEFSGIVDMVGPEVTELMVGDAVVADCLLYCGECEQCRRGRTNLCRKLAAIGQMTDGGLAQWVVAPAYTFVKIPPRVPLDQAALAEPLAVAVRAVTRARLEPGDRVLITGAGAIGLLALQVARVQGAGWVAVVEPRPARRQLAIQLGANEAVSSAETLPLSGDGFNRAIECTGKPEAQAAALDLLCPQGRLVLVGIPTGPSTLDTLVAINGEKEIVGSLSHLAKTDFQTGVSLLSQGQIQVAPLISRRYALRQAKEAFQVLENAGDDVVKILFSPSIQTLVQETVGG